MDNRIKLNLGCVVYTETKDGISAEWISSKNDKVDRGSGIGIRITELNKNREFEGDYEIIYSDINGNKSPKLRLMIYFDSGIYKLSWSYKGETTEVGIGFESDGKLLVSYTEVV